MKKTSIFMILLIFMYLLVGCVELNENPDDISLLYSRSFDNFNDFEQPILVIDNYDSYLSSGYPLDLDENFFNNRILYTYSFEHYCMGTNIFLFNSYKITDDGILVIYYETDNDILVLDAEGMYAMIFEIDKDLYHSADSLEVREFDNLNEEIELLYSGSYSNYHDFDEPITWITSHEEYFDSDYPFELDEAYFDNYSLYTYSFVHSDLGRNIFLYDNFLLVDNTLFITCVINNELIVSPAFGSYALVFAIPKGLINNNVEVLVAPNGSKDLIFDELTEVRSVSTSQLLYFELMETQLFSINFNREGTWSITAITGRLFNISNNQEISMSMFSGLYGYQATLEPGEYIFILDIRNNEYSNESFYIFDYNAILFNED